MPDTPLAALDLRLQAQYHKAAHALTQGHCSYSITIARALLQNAPSCAEIRQLLRAAQRQGQTGQKVGLGARLCGIAITVKLAFWTNRKATADAYAAAGAAESALAQDPACLPALRLLGTAAAAADWPTTAVQTWQAAAHHPKANAEDWVQLGRAHLNVAETTEAVQAAERALQLAANHSEAETLLKAASVEQSLQSGWTDRNARSATHA